MLPPMVFRAVVMLAPMLGASSPRTPWKTVAGVGKSGFGGDTHGSLVHGFAVESRLNSPWGLALHKETDRLYVADSLNNVVRSVDLQTGLMETIAGTGDAGADGDNAPAVRAHLNLPTGLALDTEFKVLYVSDTNNHVVRAIGVADGTVYQAEHAQFPVDGVPRLHRICPNISHALDSSPLVMGSSFCQGNTGEGYVKYVLPIEDFIEFTVDALFGFGPYELRFRYADRYGAPHPTGGRRMRLIVNERVEGHDIPFRPSGMVQDGRRDVFDWVVVVAELDTGVNKVRLEVTGHGGPLVDQLYVVPVRPFIWRVAGTGFAGPPVDLGDLSQPQEALSSPLHTPIGLAIDVEGRLLYIADADNGRVYSLDISRDRVTAGTLLTIAGGGLRASTRDGERAADGSLIRPVGLTLDSAREYLYIVDVAQHRVRRVDLTDRLYVGGFISTVCGYGAERASFDLLLRSPQDVAIDDARGVLYVTDREHGRIRAVNLSLGLCPNQEVSRLQCGFDGISAFTCASLGCCYQADHEDCRDEFNADGRPSDVMTIIDGAAANPPISFVHGRSGQCCYPKLRDMSSLEILDSPQGLVLDTRNNAIYVTQAKRHRIVRLFVDDSRCEAGLMSC